MMNGAMMKHAIACLNSSMKEIGREVNVEEFADIVGEHAIATAVSAAASGAIPGAGGTIALGISCASTIAMYGRLASAAGVKLNNGLVKAVASAVVADLTGAIIASLAVSTVISLIPGVGTASSAVLTGVTNYGFVYLAGIIFIKMMAALGVSKMESMSAEELIRKAQELQSEMDLKAAMKEAKAMYKANV